MKQSIFLSTGAFCVLIMLLLVGVISADPSVAQTPETQGLTTTTTMNAIGMASETDNLAWQLSNLNLSSTLTAPGYLPYDAGNMSVLDWVDIYKYAVDTPGQDLYTTAYDANILAQAGQISLVKSMNVNTGNKVIGQSNVDANTGVTFIATDDGGNVVGSEDLLLDGAAMYDRTIKKALCPFAAQTNEFIPPACNIVQTGSQYDLTIGSVTTAANNQFVSSDSTVPVAQNYNINVKPYDTTDGQIPAQGAASAYMKVHIQEGRLVLKNQFILENDEANVYKVVKSEDVTYSETTSVLGSISAFGKSFNYKSGITLLP